MLNRSGYPAEQFQQAWRNVILYDEHTWGAHCSISQPESDFTKAQWKIKQTFALNADLQSRNLLNSALVGHGSSEKQVTAIDVFNTSSWTRTDLVVLPKDMEAPGDVVRNPEGQAVKSQRLSTGELAFLAQDVAPFSARRFTFADGQAAATGSAEVKDTELKNGTISLTINKKTGAAESLKWKQQNIELVNSEAGLGLNDYFYVAGRDPTRQQRNGPVTIRIKELGPLVASLLIESDAPGCNKLVREFRVIDGIDRVDIINIIDKQNIYEQESIHLAFPFKVPEGVMRMEIPWAVVRPETDQLAGACKNYFTVQRWVDVSNADYGVTLATPDAPLIEIGDITTDPTGSTVGWIKTIEPSTTLYSYVMNNYWETNYKAGQEGPTMFRYSIEPHRSFDSGRAAKFGAEQSQPLIAVPVDSKTSAPGSIMNVEPTSIIVTAFRPSEDGKDWIVRLFNAGGQSEKAIITWAEPSPDTIWLSNLAEEKLDNAAGPVEMTAYDIVTLRASPPGK
jgi:alpha-mannosidase